MSVDDKYTYPGSGGVLVNSKGIREAARLDAALNDYASAAMAELRVEPVQSQPGYEYLRHIHTRMFERIAPGIHLPPNWTTRLNLTGLLHQAPEPTSVPQESLPTR